MCKLLDEFAPYVEEQRTQLGDTFQVFFDFYKLSAALVDILDKPEMAGRRGGRGAG